MKKFFVFVLSLIIAVGTFSQQSWTKSNNQVSLYLNSDKVGIGTTGTPGSKLIIQSISGETPLALKGNSTQTNPFLNLLNSRSVSLWRLYATTGWWTIGNSFDSTSAIFSVKPIKNWIRINGTVYATAFIGTVDASTLGGSTLAQIKADTGANNKFAAFYDMTTKLAGKLSTLGTAANSAQLQGKDTTYLKSVCGPVYTKYVAKLNQTGTDAPTATVLENTTGHTFTWSRAGIGEYYVLCSGTMPTLKTCPTISDVLSAHHIFITPGGPGPNYCQVQIKNLAGALTELSQINAPNYLWLEIRIYP